MQKSFQRLISLENKIQELADKIRSGEAEDKDYYLIEKYRLECLGYIEKMNYEHGNGKKRKIK